MPAPLQIESPRLLLRPLQEADASAFFEAARETQEGLLAWYSGPLTRADLTVDQTRENIVALLKSWVQKSFFHYGAFEKASGRLIGIGSIHHLNWSVPKGRLGYWVRRSAQGQGFAQEIAQILTQVCFEKLGFIRLEIRAATGNAASKAIPRKLGYRFLTIFEKNLRSDAGVLWDLEIHVRFDLQGLAPLPLRFEESA